ncbi:MAG: methyltransferase, partial [Candidatus Eisenbacteria bacterium]|nr:methyltransferase [Candidatus Eisenbacteria bacterium]
VQAGLFEDLARHGPSEPDEIATRLRLSPGGTRALLAALRSSGYLVLHRAARYGNAPLATRWLVSDRPDSAVPYLRFMIDQWGWITRTEEILASGRPIDIHSAGQDPAYWQRYMEALAAIARSSAPDIVRAIPMPRAPRRLLDVAGGHGVFSAAACRLHPQLTAEILDLEDPARAGRVLVEREGMAERVRYRTGDLRTTSWGEGYDAILYFNIAHHLDERENRDAFARARAALVPGGVFALWDFEAQEDARGSSQIGGLMSLFFFLTSGRSAHPQRSLRDWLAGAGFRDIRSRRIRKAPFGFLLTGRA